METEGRRGVSEKRDKSRKRTVYETNKMEVRPDFPDESAEKADEWKSGFRGGYV
ncbi:MAG: hypothetical protein K2O01_01130 [Bacteroidales bacterium]|nr:hypothetical protein [Bacteroidales bacterium]